MNTYLEIGIGKRIEEKFFEAKNEILISTPNISTSIVKKLMNCLEKGIRIKIILSESTNKQTRESIDILLNYSKNNKKLEIKIVDFYQAALIHAKIYIIDKKFAIVGSANLTENGFYNYVEFIQLFKDENDIKIIEKDYQKLWKLFEC